MHVTRMTRVKAAPATDLVIMIEVISQVLALINELRRLFGLEGTALFNKGA